MKKNLLLTAIACILMATATLSAQKTKVVCVGNSITEGIGASSGSTNYPALLQKYLGTERFEVINRGASGRTMLKNGKEFGGEAASYWDHERYQLALNDQPDIVIIKLGTNDAKKVNWDNIKDEFKPDYIDMVNSFKALASQPKIYVCYPIPLYGPGNWINDDKVMTDEMMPIISEVAEETDATLIDLHTPFEGKAYLSDDKVHPNDKGYYLLAHTVAKAICPDCTIEDLPADYFVQVADFSLTDKQTACTSSVEGLELTALTDKDATTAVETDMPEDEVWFEITMPADMKVTAYAITAGSNTDNAPRTWQLQSSTDQKKWRTANSQKDVTFLPNETKIINLSTSSAARMYYRLRVTGNNGGGKLSIAEWQLFGSQQPLPESLMNTEGTVTAQFNRNDAEGVTSLTDSNTATKYCIQITGGTCWFAYELQEPTRLTGYTLISGNDAVERDPVAWTLEGSDNGQSWVSIDRQQDQMFGGRLSTMEYRVETSKAYKHYRINVMKIKNGDWFQLSEWQLFGETETSGLTAAEETGVSVYGGSGSLTMRAENKGSYRLISATGQSVAHGTVTAGESRSLHLPAGLYLLHLTAAGQESVSKVLVK